MGLNKLESTQHKDVCVLTWTKCSVLIKLLILKMLLQIWIFRIDGNFQIKKITKKSRQTSDNKGDIRYQWAVD
jgi:hypothetical protein